MATKHNGRDHYIAWLKDAHAMERALETALTKQAKHARAVDGVLEQRISQHVQETRRHAELVEQALMRNGADPSAMKDAAGRMQASIQGMLSGASSDTPVKDALVGIAAEHFEIACYRSLETAAREIGDMETAEVCDEIIRDEEAMATFLEGQLPRVTQLEMAEATAHS